MNDGKIGKTVFICLILCVSMASAASAAYPYGPKVSPQKNVEIVDLIVSPTTPILDEPIDIIVIVRNNGKSSENVRVVIKSEWWETLEGEEKIRTEDAESHQKVIRNLKRQEIIKTFDNVSLTPGESRSVKCRYTPRYNPRDNDIIKKKDKSYMISARVTSDQTSRFDLMSKSITVVSEPPGHDLLISGVCDERGRTFYNDEHGNPFNAIKMVEGEAKAICVMVANGSRVFYEDAVVSVKMGGKKGGILGANTVKIGAKEVGAVTISLDTEAINPGTYELYVEVKPVKGEVNLVNNSTIKTLIVEEKQNRRMKR